jgi:hypothetical protein
MPRNSLTLLRTICLIITLAIFVGCTSNIDHIPTTTTMAPQAMIFDAPLNRVWSATQTALSSDATFKILDKAASIMVTEFKTVNSKELSIIGTTFLGKTYKSSYTVNFQPKGTKKTEVRVNVGLKAQQIGFFTREEDQPQVKSHLRNKLYEQIAVNLRR